MYRGLGLSCQPAFRLTRYNLVDDISRFLLVQAKSRPGVLIGARPRRQKLSMRRAAAAAAACSRALQSNGAGITIDAQLAERLLSSSQAGPSQASQAANVLFHTLQQNPQAARCFARAFSAVAGRAPPTSGLPGVQRASRAACRQFQQVTSALA